MRSKKSLFCEGLFLYQSQIYKIMNPTKANLINGLVLLLLGLFNHFTSLHPTRIGLIAPVVGIVFIITTSMLKKNNKSLYFFIISLNTLLLGLLTQQFIETLGNDSEMRFLSRLITMLFSCLVTTFVFVKYYLDNRWRI